MAAGHHITDKSQANQMNRNDTKRGMAKAIAPEKLMQGGFLTLGAGLIIIGAREPFLVSQILLYVLAAVVSAAPFVFLAVARQRDEKERAFNADAQERRQNQTRREIRRMMKADVETLRLRTGANDDAEARRKAIARYVEEEILPQVSHAIIASERPMWLQEAQVQAQALLETPPAEPTRLLIDACLGRVSAAGWDATTDGDGMMVQSGEACAYFQCLHADAPIDTDAVDAFVARLKSVQIRRGAIVAHQAFTPAALQHARAHGVGLIRPAHVPTFLEWAARASAPAKKSA